jgi:hypothetical protein
LFINSFHFVCIERNMHSNRRKSRRSNRGNRRETSKIGHNQQSLGLPPAYKSQPRFQRKFRFRTTDAVTGDGVGIYRHGLLSLLTAISGPAGSPMANNTTATTMILGIRLVRVEFWAPPPTSGINQASLFLSSGSFGSNVELTSTASSAGIQSVSYTPAPTETLGMWSTWNEDSSQTWKDELFTLKSADAGCILDIVVEFVLRDSFEGYTAVYSCTARSPGVYTNALDVFDADGTSPGVGIVEPVGVNQVGPAPTGGLTVVGN